MMSGEKKNRQSGGSALSRRLFIKGSAAAAGMTALGAMNCGAQEGASWTSPREFTNSGPVTAEDVKVIHSVCLGCNARCGNRAVVRNGVLEQVSGNPYHPYNGMGSGLDSSTPVSESLSLPSPVCGKAHDAPNYTANPYRILKPLKRCGPRGSGKFEPIEWEQMIEEIGFGGRLFKHLGENRQVEGLKDLDSDQPIDPGAPELGPRRNGFIFMTGRLQSGRKAFINRFVKGSMGSNNRIGHTDICGIGFRMGNYALTEKKAWELKADPWNAEYILVFGANIYEALQPGVNTYGAAVARRSSQGNLKFTVVDPRGQNAVVHAEDWIAIKPGQDGAFAMGMIRWMIENNAFNRKYLAAPNPEAARRLGHGCYVNATHLVIDEPGHAHHRRFLRAADLDDSADQPDDFMVFRATGEPPISFTETAEAVLDQDGVLTDAGGRKIRVKTVFKAMLEGVMEHGLDDYAGFAGVSRRQIEETARSFSSHGTRAAVCQYHGAGNYLNGTYAAYAVAVLNALVGSVEMKGGYLTSGGSAAGWKDGLYDLSDFTGKRKGQGVKISREKSAYESSTEYRNRKAATGSGYPARRPWYSFTRGGLSVESNNSIDQRYPYPCKVLFQYFYNPVYSTPGGFRYKETLADPEKVPLFVSIDTCINESNLYADYIVPDITYPEGHYGWLSPHAPVLKFTGFRTPLIKPLTGKTADGRAFCLENLFIDLAKKLELPGFGERAIPAKDGSLFPLNRPEDFYLRGFANICHNAGVPEGSREDVSFVEDNYPVAEFKDILPRRQWVQTCRALARGGVFHTSKDVFDREIFRYGLERIVLYNEDMATARNSLSGEYFHGSLKYMPPADSGGNVIEEVDREYPFYLISHKMNVHTQSRTSSHKWAMEIFPENFIVMHADDAKKEGIREGDWLRLVSRSNAEGVKGRVTVSRLVRPGCLGLSHHYGHSQHGASSVEVDKGEDVFLGGDTVVNGGRLVPDEKRGRGLSPNLVSRLDENLADTPLVDVQAGIPDFSSTRVKVYKVTS